MSQESARRKFSLHGEGSRIWLADRHIFGEVGPDFRVVSDEIVFAGFRAARLWHNEGEYSIARPSSTALLLVQIEGESILSSSLWGAGEALGPGGVAVLPGATAAFHFSAARPVARYQIEYDLAGLPLLARTELGKGMVFSNPAKEYRNAVTATANIILNSTLSPGDAGLADFGVGLRYLTTALLLNALEGVLSVRQDAEDGIYRAALRVIAKRATDPHFDVESLARAVGTSPRNLRHLFSQEGSSAKAALTAERVRRARAYAAKKSDGLRLSQTEISRLSGFRDLRALRRALEKDDDPA